MPPAIRYDVVFTMTKLEALAAGLARKVINDAFRKEATQAFAEHAHATFDRHYQLGANQRYGYVQRSGKYNALKRRLYATGEKIYLRGFDGMGGDLKTRAYTIGKPPVRDMVFSGILEQYIRRGKWGFPIETRSKFEKLTVKMKIPLPHFMKTEHAREIGVMSKQESYDLLKKVTVRVRKSLGLQVRQQRRTG